MSTTPPPNQPDPDLLLDRDIHAEVMEALREMLPPPPIDTPDAWARRERAAIAKVASLVPASAAEADLAVHHVAAMAHARDCQRQMMHHAADPRFAAKLRSQAAGMWREARGFLGKLLALQAARSKRDANDTARDAAVWTEHCVLNQLTDALEHIPPAGPQPPAPPPAAAAAPVPPAEQPRLLDYDERPEEEKQKDRLRAKADRYAILHATRVKLIRQLGGLPPDCDFEPPEPDVLHAIITGNTSSLRWADTYQPWVPPTE